MVHVFKDFICFARLEFLCRQLKAPHVTSCVTVVYKRIFETLLTRVNPILNLNTHQSERKKSQSGRETLFHC